MQNVPCDACGKMFPMDSTYQGGDRVLCPDCALEEAEDAEEAETEEKTEPESEGPESAESETPAEQPDPTICVHCGNASSEEPLALLAGLATCPACETYFRNRPFPGWLKLSLLGVAILLVGATVWHARFFRAYANIRSSFAAYDNGDLEAAAAAMDRAAKLVPEDRFLPMEADFLRGLSFLSQDRSAEALVKFQAIRADAPADWGIDELILDAQISKAVEEKDYDTFLKLSLEKQEQRSEDPMSIGSVASAYACKYAVTGEANYKQESLAWLDRARAAAGEDPMFQDYEQRIRYRLHSREVIDSKEFHERFPNGWQEPTEKQP